MPKIIFLDTFYPDVVKALPPATNYLNRQEQIRNLWFGTADFYSHEFYQMGWEALDIVGNDHLGRRLWAVQAGVDCPTDKSSVMQQICRDQPDVLYCQDLNFLTPSELRHLKGEGFVKTLAAQHSCPWAGDEQVAAFDVVFTSFPHYIERIKALRVDAEFLPIAFGGPRVLEYLKHKHKADMSWKSRVFKITFVGGVGGGETPGHWGYGTKVLMSTAEAFKDEFQWWGYGQDNIPKTHPLRTCYRGSAWGVDMYQAYAKSKMVVNRHGEVADGNSNNMRMFEATGCGALLFTEESKNIRLYFEPGKECVTYTSTEDLCRKIEHYLKHDDEAREIANAGHERTMAEHTYARRLAYPESILRYYKPRKGR